VVALHVRELARDLDGDPLLALNTKLPGGHCLTHLGRERSFDRAT